MLQSNRIDSFARNRLIYNGTGNGLCGLRAYGGGRGWREEWPGESKMWLGKGHEADRRSPQASARTPAHAREFARADKKKPQPRTVEASLLVEAAGIEPASGNPLPLALHA